MELAPSEPGTPAGGGTRNRAAGATKERSPPGYVRGLQRSTLGHVVAAAHERPATAGAEQAVRPIDRGSDTPGGARLREVAPVLVVVPGRAGPDRRRVGLAKAPVKSSFPSGQGAP